MEESARTLWCKRSASKRSEDDHRRVDYKMGSSDIGGVQEM